MQGCGAQPCQGLAMERRAVAHMALQAIARKAQRQAADQGIAFFFREDAGGGDGGAEPIPPLQSALRPRPEAQGQDAIHHDQRNGPTEALERAQHGLFSGATDAEAVDLASAGLTDSPGDGPLPNQGDQRGALAGAEGLAVGETGRHKGSLPLRRKDHRRGEDRTEEAAPAHLIHTRQAVFP